MGLSRLFFNIPFINAVYPVAGAILFSLYLAHHTRLIVSGKNNEYRMNEKDYILGAMTLYLDIINIFLKLLEIFGRTSNDKKHNK
jgi:FtsH-binding integral membrane protein